VSKGGDRALGLPRLHLRRTDSTNNRARELAARGAPHGTLVTAVEQTAGRGRQGRSWVAPPGSSLLCSLLVREWPRLLPLATGVAVAETCDALLAAAPPAARVGERALIKWPNDVLLGQRKVAGILIEARPQDRWAVIGVGLNVALDPDMLSAELRGRVGTLGLGPEAVELALTRLLERLERWLEPTIDEDELLRAVRARDALGGRAIAWQGSRGRPGRGTVVGIGDDGALLVETESGERLALDGGEVHLLDGPC